MHTVLHAQNFDRFQIPEANLSLFQPTRQSMPFTAQTMSAGIFASDLRPGSHEHTTSRSFTNGSPSKIWP